MPNEIDQIVEREQAILEMRIQAAREAPGALKGPTTCKCGSRNDRAPQGYAICSACMEEIRNG